MTDDELERRFDGLMRRVNDNHEVVLIEMRGIQGELRDVRAEQKGIRTYIGARAAETESLMQRLFDRLNDRLDQSERGIEERLRKLEDKAP